ncbi:MAG: thiamine phosphate synthase [Parvularculaceae bacterium]
MSDIGRHVGLRVRTAKLAAAADALKRESRVKAPFSLAFLTDRRRIANPEPILRVMPPGSAVIYRDYDDPKRQATAARYRAICRARGLLFLVAGDVALAAAVDADGLHRPSRDLAAPPAGWSGLVTAACHDLPDLQRAAISGAALAFLSPVFPTESHPERAHLGAERFRALAAASPLPVIALGGVDENNARAVAGANIAGLAAIGAFAA